MSKTVIPDILMDELTKAKKEIIKHHGQAVYNAAINGDYPPPTLVMLIRKPERQIIR